MSRALTAAAVLAMFVSAAQAGAVVGKCLGGKCDTFEVVEQSQLKTDALHGERLIHTIVKSWVQEGEERTGESEETGYVFCSKKRPAMLIQDNGKTLVKFLAPAAKADVESNINLYASYYEVCHAKGAEVAQRLDELAKELDYKVSRATSTELKQANKPESVFWWTTPDVKVASPLFLEEPTTTAKPPTVSTVDPKRRERIAKAEAVAKARRVAAVRAREFYAAASRQDQYQGREALAQDEMAQRAIYVPVRREPQGLFESVFGAEK